MGSDAANEVPPIARRAAIGFGVREAAKVLMLYLGIAPRCKLPKFVKGRRVHNSPDSLALMRLAINRSLSVPLIASYR